MGSVIEVARHGDTVYARISGLGSFNNAGPFREFVDAMIHDGVRRIVIDLARCTGLDSTFLGTMMGFITCPLQEGAPQQSASDSTVSVIIVNLNPVTDRAISSLGLRGVFDIRSEPVPVPALRLKRLGDGWDDPRMRLRLIQEAHEHLTIVDRANADRFGPFLKALLADLRSKTQD